LSTATACERRTEEVADWIYAQLADPGADCRKICREAEWRLRELAADIADGEPDL